MKLVPSAHQAGSPTMNAANKNCVMRNELVREPVPHCGSWLMARPDDMGYFSILP